MKYQVPQFIDVEDKIFDPFTFRQFVYMAGGAGSAFLAYKLLPAFVGIIVALPLIAFGLALAFYRVNNRPFIEVVQSAFEYMTKSRLYIWKKEDKKPQSRTQKGTNQEMSENFSSITSMNPRVQMTAPIGSNSKLKDLNRNLDIGQPTTTAVSNADNGLGGKIRRI
jgi:hypothetical protein